MCTSTHAPENANKHKHIHISALVHAHTHTLHTYIYIQIHIYIYVDIDLPINQFIHCNMLVHVCDCTKIRSYKLFPWQTQGHVQE